MIELLDLYAAKLHESITTQPVFFGICRLGGRVSAQTDIIADNSEDPVQVG
jgi:hypothetical protein